MLFEYISHHKWPNLNFLSFHLPSQPGSRGLKHLGQEAKGKRIRIQGKVMNNVIEVTGKLNNLMSDECKCPSLYSHKEKQQD